ncbi:MAG TPA: TonB-dependent receptor [Rhizomicrobium sp.]|nr:TonB-dependent receptor [Rhizomicrobium sp.]
MPAPRAGAARSLLFLNALLLASTMAVPAMAQIEEVVVTAQKKSEDVQNVPIAVTAFTGQDLKEQQITQFKDLQFHAPNVTYSAGQYGSADFQIRGIGVTAIGYDSESGVAVNFDETYLGAPQLTEGSFYDLSGVEILAGPQSTLYGRGATGGAVNINIAKPDLENASVQMIGDYGNYDATKLQGTVNIPIITDQLGIRIAGEWDKRDGFVTNIYDDSKVDSLDEYSVRSTLRWQPTEKTTIDFTGEFSKEDDSHMRGDKQLCTTDPTGILGCLPGSAGTEPVNAYSNSSVIASSQQGLSTAAGALGPFLGLYNLTAPLTLPAGYVDPTSAREINTDFTPVWRSQDNYLSAKWHQTLTPWLDSTLILGYDENSYLTQESYNNIPGLPFTTNTNTAATGLGFPANTANCLAAALGSPNLNCAEQTFLGYLTAIGGPAYAANYAKYFSQPGALPISGIGGFGLTGNNYSYVSNNIGIDQDNENFSQYSAEWRFATSFSGPLNAMLGLYYLHTQDVGDYYVTSPTLDYPGIILGGLSGLADPACYATGCIYSPSYYHNEGEYADLTSKAIFGEVYYQAIPDLLKFTAGLRLTDDQKTQSDRITFLNGGDVPIGTTSEATGIPASVLPYDTTKQDFTKFTGRFVTDYTPKLDFTDSTLIYASYARGYKAGGANPGLQANNSAGIPLTYNPEYIDAYELGTKNRLFGNTLQANGDIYYYNYNGLQVSSIVDNTSVNQNINAKVWGAEGSFLWQATDRLQFGLNAANESSSIQNTSLVDPRNPTGGNPNTLLIKDDTISATTGSNCVLYYSGAFPGLPANFTAPVGGVHALASQGIPNVAFGSCSGAAPAGYSWTNPATGGIAEGQPVSLNGNALQNAPQLALGASAQYVQPLPGDYSLTARVDYHWQTHMWARIFEDGADYIKSQDIMNASLQLNPPDDLWYAQIYMKNIFNRDNITGEYLASATSGLYTNAFYGDPQTYGIELGVKF